MRDLIKYLVFGALFGIILTKSEVISWFRIQEMFRFQSFHMYGVIGSAVLVGAVTVWLLRITKFRTTSGEQIRFVVKPYNKGLLIGGVIFGMGWALTGACPGPLFALTGNGYSVFIAAIVAGLAGAWTYGFFRDKLPH